MNGYFFGAAFVPFTFCPSQIFENLDVYFCTFLVNLIELIFLEVNET